VLLLLLLLCILIAAPAVRAGVSIGTIEEDPQVVKQRQLDKAEADYKEGMKARAAGDASNAVRLLLRVAETEKHGLRSPFAPKAFDELKALFDEAQKDLQVARQLVAGEDPAAGLSELKRITRTYMGLGPAKEAGALARQLEGDAQFQATLKSARLAEELKKAEAVEAQAAAALEPPKPEAQKPEEKPDPSKLPTAPPPAPMPEGVGAVNVRLKEPTPAERQAARIARLLEAYDLYGRIVAQGADTGPGKKAAAARARLEKDADLMARLELAKAERKARELLSLAENYYRAGRFDSAREYCRKVISTYPQTVQASDAKTLLERMK
jgi:tetratricopeptide (TPR) repeat protein